VSDAFKSTKPAEIAPCIGGYLIPDETLTWTLREMRAEWAAAAARKDEK